LNFKLGLGVAEAAGVVWLTFVAVATGLAVGDAAALVFVFSVVVTQAVWPTGNDAASTKIMIIRFIGSLLLPCDRRAAGHKEGRV
jgi:hypothetical protein